MTDTPTETTIFRRHDRVRKVTGDYQIDGTVACAFMTLDGAWRVVVDHRPAAKGMLHIYNPGQLAMIEESLDRSDDPEDMAALGRSFMDALDMQMLDPTSPLHGWLPAEDPAEVIGDLVEMVRDAREARSAHPSAPTDLRGAVIKALQPIESKASYAMVVHLADAVLSAITAAGYLVVLDGSGAHALSHLADEDARNDKLHDLLETIREQIRVEIAPEHRPTSLMTNVQTAVYAMRGRTRLLDDAAIICALSHEGDRLDRAAGKEG